MATPSNVHQQSKIGNRQSAIPAFLGQAMIVGNLRYTRRSSFLSGLCALCGEFFLRGRRRTWLLVFQSAEQLLLIPTPEP
jgi:hypothetical protein